MKNTTKNLYHERILTVLLHIQSHLDEDLSLESLAEITYFSPVHFHRIFKGMMGETVVEHIRRIRLERAAMRLVCGQSTVTEASFDAGYETVESFSRAFRKMFGCPPSKYRDKHWEAMHARLPGIIHYLPETARDGLDIKPIGGTKMEVRIENIEPTKVIFVRHTGPYQDCETAWNTLCGWACPKGLCEVGTSKFIGVCYDDPQVTPPEKIRYDACIVIDREVEGEGEIGTQTLEGGEYAITTHKGPYTTIEKSYAQLMGQWLPQSGKQLRNAPCFEVYLNDPKATPPEDLLTELHLPLQG